MAATSTIELLEQFNRIAVRIFQLDLLAAGTHFHLIAKPEPGLFQCCDMSGKIGNLKDHPVPSPGLLVMTTWHRPGPRGPGTTEE